MTKPKMCSLNKFICYKFEQIINKLRNSTKSLEFFLKCLKVKSAQWLKKFHLGLYYKNIRIVYDTFGVVKMTLQVVALNYDLHSATLEVLLCSLRIFIVQASLMTIVIYDRHIFYSSNHSSIKNFHCHHFD
jgi:hypothetical protein